ncbi:LOW QUALITY PROTEIN: procollagen lysyl hydroxylase [Tachypleus tridentatus]|uniref:LOW QUALITY PROTEIN: procollagen lysyl hydroxylase n=1 Tax=Tachypleus tridentatus TaxID=6853 RepID=UPI003FD4EE35
MNMAATRVECVTRLAFLLCVVYVYLTFLVYCHEEEKVKLLVVTVATSETEGFQRFMSSAKLYGYRVEVLGLNEPWEGGDVLRYPGGGQKVNLLRKEMEKHKDKDDLIILFTDSYDVIFTGGPEEILKKFYKSKAKVLFSAEGFCWPDESLAKLYPKPEKGKRYLNSGVCLGFSHTGFMGFAPQIYKIVSHEVIGNMDDDQLFYTKVFLQEDLRKDLSIKLDHKADIFQNLNGAVGDVELRFSSKDSYLHNTAYGTNPIIIHGNGPSKVVLNSLGNYLARSWLPSEGCLACKKDTISLSKKKMLELPRVLVGIFIEFPTPFISLFFERILAWSYPKERMDLFIHNRAEYHKKHVEEFISSHKHKYHSVTYLRKSDDIKDWHARNLGLEECAKVNCDYYFSVDSDAHITNPMTLRLLIEQNRPILAPLLTRPNKLWSNFWGALSSDGYYSRSSDYLEIVKNNRRGVWNVPFISGAYLIHGSLLKKKESFPSFIHGLLDPDMAFCKNLRDKGMFMYVTNMEYFGHLINSETFDTSHVHNDLYEIYTNQLDWEEKYIHKNYSRNLEPDHQIDMPCPDVYWFPVVTETFCKHLIEEMENFGKWSDGSNSDPRLAGGYENVPTRDIHMNQIGFEQHWLYFLREYIRPVQEKVFTGYLHDPPKALMNFVVRYRPDEQPSLRPHHDSSTYTINIALNRPHIDFEGGGCRFIRYNCSVREMKIGWSFIHPGRLTHYHEGLKVEKGTRYIMVSFVDP